MKAKVRTVKQKVIIPASPKEVYEAYVDSKKLSKITGSKATGKAVVGGKFTTYGESIVGKYLEVEDGKRVVQEWTNNDYGFGPVRLELCFKMVPKGTEVVMVLSGCSRRAIR
jgi:uncharacterized protein YndB with AHSA1/START domain